MDSIFAAYGAKSTACKIRSSYVFAGSYPFGDDVAGKIFLSVFLSVRGNFFSVAANTGISCQTKEKGMLKGM